MNNILSAVFGCLIALVFGTIQQANADIAFKDKTVSAGLTNFLYGGYGSSWVDYNRDGWLDVWISNHMYRPNLYINNGNGTFSDKPIQSWLGIPSWQGVPFIDAHGGAWADFDNDGDQDFALLAGVLAGTVERDKPFYVNSGGILIDEAATRGLNDTFGRGRTPLWLDWNNDGLLDLYMANFRRPNDALGPTRLMLQQSNGNFVELPEMIQDLKSFFAQLAYFDSAVHLVVSGGPYPKKVFQVGNPVPLPIFLEPAMDVTDVEDAAVADFDGDLSDDLLVLRLQSGLSSWVLNSDTHREIIVDAHDLSKIAKGSLNFSFEGPSRLVIRVYDNTYWTPEMIHVGASNSTPAQYAYEVINDRQWKFIELTLDVTDPAVNGILSKVLRTTPGIYIGWKPDTGKWQIEIYGTLDFRAKFVSADAEFANVTSDGREFWTKVIGHAPLMLSRRDGKFHVTDLGLGEAITCTSIVAGDFDNDMDIDAYLSCGAGLRNKPNILLENIDGAFVQVPNAGGANTQKLGTGGRVSVADYDNDGYLDLLVTDGGEHEFPFHFGRRYLLHNMGGSNHWLKINLRGCQSNRDGIGARVIVQAGGRQQARLKTGGIHNGVQDDRRLHFGLGQNIVAESVTVEWPSGERSNRTNLAADQTHIIRENSNCPRP